MVCPDTPGPWPPPPPPHPPDGGGGDGCNIIVYECDCSTGTPVWNLVSSDCVSNDLCSGMVTCTGKAYSAEIVGGCDAGVPLDVYTPDENTPPCVASCCENVGKKCQFQWSVNCIGGAWTVPVVVGRDCVVCAETDWMPNAGCTRFKYTCGDICGDIPNPDYPPYSTCVGAVAPVAPAGPVPNCCINDPGNQRQCAFQWTATCSGGAWSMSPGTPYGDCITHCTPDHTWQFTDSCNATWMFCANYCNDDGDCGSIGPPLAPGGTPSCCLPYCNCTYTSTWDCNSSTWSTPTLVGSCTTDATDDSTPWGYDGGGLCSATTIVTAVGACD